MTKQEAKTMPSSRSRSQPLQEEALPEYPDGRGDRYGISPELPPEKPQTHAPSTTTPFIFSSSNLPDNSAVDISKPYAIPQTTPSPDAPFLAAYPPALLSYGITTQSWCSFVETLSAFLSAKVSKQALHHASDVATQLGGIQKQYAVSVKQTTKNIGKSAKSFSPFGIIGGGVVLTLGCVGHTVGSMVTLPFVMLSKPKTPRERATVYLAAANKDWFQPRGLQAMILNTEELAKLLEIQPQQFIALARNHTQDAPEEQLSALSGHIGELQVRDTHSPSQSTEPAAGEGSQAVDKRPRKPQLLLGSTTLWLVITQESQVQTVPAPDS